MAKVTAIGAADIENQEAFKALTECAELAVNRRATDLVVGMKLRDGSYSLISKGRADSCAMLSLLLQEQALGMLEDR